MTTKPLVAFCLYENFSCPILEAMRGLASGEDSHARIAARILRINRGVDYTEVWFRASGSKEKLEEFVKRLKKMPGVYTQVVYSSSFNRVARTLIASSYCEGCIARWDGLTPGCCPLMGAPLGSMAKTAVVTPKGVLVEYIVAKKQALDYLLRRGCKLLLSHGLDEYDYWLTEKQEEMLIVAYLMGYYSFPRRISLRELAERLGISVSTLAEHLRRAEAKVVEAFVRHELPHYLVDNLTGQLLLTGKSGIGKKPRGTRV